MVLRRDEVKEVVEKYEQICEDAYKKASEETQVFHKHWLDSPWSGFFEGKDPLKVIYPIHFCPSNVWSHSIV